MKSITGTWVFLLLIVVWTPLQAQNNVRDKLRMARAFEQGTDQRQASRLFQEVYAEDNSNLEAFDGVVRTLMALQQYDALVPLVKQQFNAKKNGSVGILLGELLWRTSDMRGADSVWALVVDNNGRSLEVRLKLANTYSTLRLYERAVKEYLKTRELSNARAAFADELCAAYTALHDVQRAAQEVLLLFEASADINRARGRLSALMTDSASTVTVLQIVSSASTQNANVLRLQQWVFRESKLWEKALQVTLKMEEVFNTQGYELLSFADGARHDGRFDIASKAYSIVIEGKYEQHVTLSAAYGFARTLDQQFRRDKMLSKSAAAEILEKYTTIVEKHPSHPLSGEAMLSMASIQEEVFGNFKEAKTLYSRVFNQWKGTGVAADAGNRLSVILFSEGADQAAVEVAANVARNTSSHNQEFVDAALLLGADYSLYSGDFDSANRKYGHIVKNAGSNATNDALDRLWLLMLMKEDSVGVVSYIRGLELEFRRRLEESVPQFQRTWKLAVDAELKDRAAFKFAKVAFNTGAIQQCQEPIQFLISRIPDTIYGDQALVLAADVFELQNDKTNAIAALTTLLVQYPKSILVPQARQRIRILRGDA